MGTAARSPRTWLDVTNLYGWHGPFTGIQRVMYGIGLQLYERGRRDFVRYDHAWHSFRIVDFSKLIDERRAMARRERPAASIADGSSVSRGGSRTRWTLLSRAARRAVRGTARRTGRAVKSLLVTPLRMLVRSPFVPGDRVVLFGGNWGTRQYSRNVIRLKERHTVALHHFMYDLVPVLNPEFFPKGFEEVFHRFLEDTAAAVESFLCISEATQKELLSYCHARGLGTPRTHVVRLGDQESPAAPRAVRNVEAGSYVLCVGTIEVRKNHALLYYAWKEGLRRGYDMPPLLIVGRNGWQSENVRDLITRDHAVRGSIRMLEGIGDAELQWLYENCLFSIYPSIHEGWGLPVAESLANGKLCLGSGIPPVREIGGDLIDYFSPFDSGECLEKVWKYCTNRAELQDRERAIKGRYHAVSWGESADELLKFVESGT